MMLLKAKLSQETRKEIAREFLSPFFTPAQIDCFFRPEWIRHRNWQDQDYQIAISLRKLMSKKAFGYLRKKRLVPMPSLTSLRQYSRVHGITIPTPRPNAPLTVKPESGRTGLAKKSAKKSAKTAVSAATTAAGHYGVKIEEFEGHQAIVVEGEHGGTRLNFAGFLKMSR